MTETFGKKLAALRKERGLTQDAVAERLSVSPQAVSKWENDSSCPDITLLPQIAKLYDTTIDTLFGREPQPETQLLPERERKKPDDLLLHILVNDAEGTRVRVNLPMLLIKTALEIGLSLPQLTGNPALENIDLEKVMLLVDRGLIGKLVEVESADGTTVEIVVD
ncbi:MAG: helix-turn-helix transcriptional regulator [Ruminococcaceae bacterium]|nr:helix-turn-helix transcriptional regulator [Oscillospiraceae bacterium]